MSDTPRSQSNSAVTDPQDMLLAREISSLEREIHPQRDLWPGIERQIMAHPQKSKTQKFNAWIPYGVAASLFMAVTALLLNMVQLNRTDPRFVSTDQSIDQMQAEYMQVRAPLAQKFFASNNDLDEKTLTDLQRNLDIMEQARRDIEAQVREHPENRRLFEMLMYVHEQELELLKQDFGHSTRFM